jgi:hypothetical protein
MLLPGGRVAQHTGKIADPQSQRLVTSTSPAGAKEITHQVGNTRVAQRGRDRGNIHPMRTIAKSPTKLIPQQCRLPDPSKLGGAKPTMKARSRHEIQRYKLKGKALGQLCRYSRHAREWARRRRTCGHRRKAVDEACLRRGYTFTTCDWRKRE